MPFSLVRIAFERTVEKKGNPNKPYINGILTKWRELGITSEEALYRHEEASRDGASATAVKTEKQSRGTSGESTFDIDEFFSAALERTYGTENKKTDEEE